VEWFAAESGVASGRRELLAAPRVLCFASVCEIGGLLFLFSYSFGELLCGGGVGVNFGLN